MPAHPFNPSTLHWTPNGPHRSGSFRPHGPLTQHGATPNPAGWSSTKTVSARLVVGFNVGRKAVYDVKDLIKIVRREREKQAKTPDASFVSQRGIYTHHDGKVVTEDGAQVFIINLGKTSKAAFTKQMIALAETICDEMQQETVIVEIQVNGISEITMGINA